MIQKEADGFYLVTEIENEQSGDDFAFRMVRENNIPHLLRPFERSFNGEKKLYYEITGLQSLETLSGVRMITGEFLRSFLESLYHVSDSLPDFFLEAEHLCLDPGLIFTDGEAFFFVYRFETKKEEDKGDDPENSACFLAEALLEMIDHEDEDAVVYAYQFYKASRQSGLTLRRKLERVLGEGIRKEAQDAEDPLLPSSLKKSAQADPEEGADQPSLQDTEKETEKNKKPDPILFSISLLLTILGAGLLIWRGIQIRPFDLQILLSGREGIPGLVFFLLGILGMAAVKFF